MFDRGRAKPFFNSFVGGESDLNCVFNLLMMWQSLLLIVIIDWKYVSRIVLPII